MSLTTDEIARALALMDELEDLADRATRSDDELFGELYDAHCSLHTLLTDHLAAIEQRRARVWHFPKTDTAP